MDKYSKAKSQSMRLNDKNNCAVIAVTVITGKHYDDVYDVFRYFGRRHGKGVCQYTTYAVLRFLGYNLERVERMPKTVNQCGNKLSKNKSYLIRTRGHILAMKAGVIHDWTKGTRRIPISIFRVVRKRKIQKTI